MRGFLGEPHVATAPEEEPSAYTKMIIFGGAALFQVLCWKGGVPFSRCGGGFPPCLTHILIAPQPSAPPLGKREAKRKPTILDLVWSGSAPFRKKTTGFAVES